MQTSELRQEHDQRSGTSGGVRRSARLRNSIGATAVLGAISFAGAAATAQDSSEIESRVDAAFAVVAAEPIAPPLSQAPALSPTIQQSEGTAPWIIQGAVTPELTPANSAKDAAGRGGAGDAVAVARTPNPRPRRTATTAHPSAAAVSEKQFFGRFAGSFAGSGQIQLSAKQNPNNVRCSLTGRPSAQGVSIFGECGALIFSRRIRADLRYDARSGRYSGIYIGASMGAARLSGRRHGDTVVLTITWPKPVNGDTKATMTILNPGNGRLLITVTDLLKAGGKKAQVTRLAFDQT